MPKLVDLTGTTFGWLTVQSRTENLGKKVAWLCECECGITTVMRTTDLQQGKVVSCGCYRRVGPRRKHGATDCRGGRTPEYVSWIAMKDRCYNPNSRAFHRYGGRGITVCERWRDSFENFLADMGERPEGKTLDRIDNDGNYEPENCRWATRAAQAQNRTWNPDSAWRGSRDERGRFVG